MPVGTPKVEDRLGELVHVRLVVRVGRLRPHSHQVDGQLALHASNQVDEAGDVAKGLDTLHVEVDSGVHRVEETHDLEHGVHLGTVVLRLARVGDARLEVVERRRQLVDVPLPKGELRDVEVVAHLLLLPLHRLVVAVLHGDGLDARSGHAHNLAREVRIVRRLEVLIDLRAHCERVVQPQDCGRVGQAGNLGFAGGGARDGLAQGKDVLNLVIRHQALEAVTFQLVRGRQEQLEVQHRCHLEAQGEVVVVVDVKQRHDCGLAQPVGVHPVEEGAQAGEVD
mmetsp:Transcript_9728/g.25873  ORF Transcript_9728/g.25873 Transcript_9728/m.25873 type:complete len:281 (-) Transcript_9728:736-1578(-)